MLLVDLVHGERVAGEVVRKLSLELIQGPGHFEVQWVMPGVVIEGGDALGRGGALISHDLLHDVVSPEILAHEKEVVADSVLVLHPETEGQDEPASHISESLSDLLEDGSLSHEGFREPDPPAEVLGALGTEEGIHVLPNHVVVSPEFMRLKLKKMMQSEPQSFKTEPMSLSERPL